MRLSWLAWGWAGLFFSLCAQAESCRLAFDVGSSGIRAGVAGSAAVARVDIDYLDAYSPGDGLQPAVAATTAALRDLSQRTDTAAGCERVAGGFSVWRMALADGPAALVDTLRQIHAASGVPLLVIPQEQEGAYGYAGSRQMLGARLTSSHVLDIGGGSLQIAGQHGSFGALLGQKVWLQTLCRELRGAAGRPCVLQPMGAADLERARALLAHALRGAADVLPAGTTLTAVSRPITRGVLPAVKRLSTIAAAEAEDRITLATLGSAIDRLTGRTLEETVELTGIPLPHAHTLLSTMLLVEGLLRATSGSTLQVAEIELTNIPGLLADDRAFAWSRRYGCYLDRLPAEGIFAYAGDPATCPPPAE